MNELRARVTRYDVAGMRMAQTLLPVVLLASIVARRWMESLTVIAALAAQLVAVIAFLRARHALGERTAHVQQGTLRLDELEVPRTSITRWCMAGNAARLYGPTSSYHLRVPADEVATLQNLLVAAFGAPLVTHRRGSPVTRYAALIIGGFGVLVIGIAVSLHNLPVLAAGIVSAILGVVTFFVLSQRVA